MSFTAAARDIIGKIAVAIETPKMPTGKLKGKTLLVEIIFFDKRGQSRLYLRLPQTEGIQLFLYFAMTAFLITTVMTGFLKRLFR